MPSKNPLCYVAHPLGAGEDRAANIEAATTVLAELQWENPDRVFVASWITLARRWPEDSKHRAAGISADLDLLVHCQEIWLVGPRISPGMTIELEHARKHGLRVVDLTLTLSRETVSR